MGEYLARDDLSIPKIIVLGWKKKKLGRKQKFIVHGNKQKGCVLERHCGSIQPAVVYIRRDWKSHERNLVVFPICSLVLNSCKSYSLPHVHPGKYSHHFFKIIIKTSRGNPQHAVEDREMKAHTSSGIIHAFNMDYFMWTLSQYQSWVFLIVLKVNTWKQRFMASGGHSSVFGKC